MESYATGDHGKLLRSQETQPWEMRPWTTSPRAAYFVLEALEEDDRACQALEVIDGGAIPVQLFFFFGSVRPYQLIQVSGDAMDWKIRQRIARNLDSTWPLPGFKLVSVRCAWQRDRTSQDSGSHSFGEAVKRRLEREREQKRGEGRSD